MGICGHGRGPGGHLPDAIWGLPDAFPRQADTASGRLADRSGARRAMWR